MTHRYGNGYIAHDEHEQYSMPERSTLLNGTHSYSPSPDRDAIPLTVFADGKGSTRHELATRSEREILLISKQASPTSGDEDNHDDFSYKKSRDEKKTPPDRLMLVYLIFVIHGIATLMPWNMFITAEDYFTDFKLNTNSSTDAEYRKNFVTYLGIASQVPNFTLNLINVLMQFGGFSGFRIIMSISIVIVMFILTVVLAMVDSFEWPMVFFIVTMVSVIIINMANGIYQNSIYGLVSCLPMKYTNAVVLGSNVSGTITSLILLLSIALAPDPRTAAIYYFVAAIIVLLLAFDTYFALPMLKFYRYFSAKKEEPPVMTFRERMRSFGKVIGKVWPQLFNVWCVFFVTLTCFPALQVGIERTSPTSFGMSDKFFTPVTCFLVFNAFAMFGNLTTELIRVPGPKWVFIPVLLRLLFIPFFAFCNFRPEERSTPVLITNDYVYVLGGVLMAFSSGYLSSLCMMYAPQSAEAKYKGTAAMMAAFCLVFGICSGVNFALAVIKVVEGSGGSYMMEDLHGNITANNTVFNYS